MTRADLRGLFRIMREERIIDQTDEASLRLFADVDGVDGVSNCDAGDEEGSGGP